MIVAFQGEPGAYSQEAIAGYFGPVETLPCQSFEAVFAAVTSQASDAGLIPIENSLAGSIHQNYDLLLRHALWITGEYFLRVRHCLIVHPGVKKSGLRRVISHPQALGQCDGYLRKLKGVKPEAVYDTAGSVKMLKESGDRTCAAIASRRAAEIYGMEILEEGIEDDPENYTRFLAVAPDSRRTRRGGKNVDRFFAPEPARVAVQSPERLRPARHRPDQDQVPPAGGKALGLPVLRRLRRRGPGRGREQGARPSRRIRLQAACARIVPAPPSRGTRSGLFR